MSSSFRDLEIFQADMNKTCQKNGFFLHKQPIKTYISEAIERLNQTDNALVLGIGNSNDIDLNLLTDNFNMIDLVDIDNKALAYTYSKIKENQRAKVRIIQTDLTGLSASGHIDRLVKAFQDTDELKLFKILESIKSDDIFFSHPKLWEHSYDLIISVCVSSQFFLPYFEFLCQSYFPDFKQKSCLLALDISYTLTNRYCQTIYNLIKPNGYVFYAGELFEWGLTPNGLTPFAQIVTNPHELNTESINRLLNEHKELKIAGAFSDKLFDLFNIAPESNIRSWWWDFSHYKYFLVRGFLLKPCQNK